jgi:hypothetical protein
MKEKSLINMRTIRNTKIHSVGIMQNFSTIKQMGKKVKGKAIPVTGHGGP